MVKTQAPGYFRMTLGDFELTAISDGTTLLLADKVLHHQSLNEVLRQPEVAESSQPWASCEIR